MQNDSCNSQTLSPNEVVQYLLGDIILFIRLMIKPITKLGLSVWTMLSVSIVCLDCDDSTASRFEVLWVRFLALKFIGFVESLLQ